MITIVRALRLPFTSASVLPFIFGSLIDRSSFNFLAFWLGLVSAVATHLGANLINDYADSRSGVDWQDSKFYKFFGGSKLIQEGLLSEAWYLKAAVFCFTLAGCSIFILSLISKNPLIIVYFILILLLGISYSHRPLELAYRQFGELAVFLLFGPALVMGGYFIQTGIFPDVRSFLLSLPFGFLTTAILFANEVPDYQEDLNCRKINWVSVFGKEQSYLLYLILIFCAFSSIAINILNGYLSVWSVISFILLLPAWKAAAILKKSFGDKTKMIDSSRVTIAIQALAGLAMILGIII